MKGKSVSKQSVNNQLTSTNPKNILVEKDDVIVVRYVDLIKLLESSSVDLRRFQQLASTTDLNELQKGNKPFVFYAIEKDDINMLKCILEQEVKLDAKYIVEVPVIVRNIDDDDTEPKEVTERKELEALAYATALNREKICELLVQKLREPTLEDRWQRVLDSRDIHEIRRFKAKLKSQSQIRDMLQIGILRAAERNYIDLIDYFLNHEKMNVNTQININGSKMTPLLKAIERHNDQVVKHLIFKGADIHIVGQYGNALTTALHYDSSDTILQLLLEKGASLADRHREWPKLSLREYCVQFSKVKAKALIDDYICKLIKDGRYEYLKYLSDNGYNYLNVKNRLNKKGRQIAVERYHYDIVELIDSVEERERRLKKKMNYQ